MLLWRAVKIAFRGIGANKMRSFLTMLGIIIGVGAIISMLSIGEGAKKQVSQSIQRFGTNLLRVSPGSARVGHVHRGTVTTLTMEDGEAIRRGVSGINLVGSSVQNMAQVKYANKNTSTAINGTTPEYSELNNFPVETGRFIDGKDLKLIRKVAVLGTTVKEELFGGGIAVGKQIKVKGANFQVIGVLKSKGATSWRDPDNQVVIPLTTSQKRLFSQNHVENIYIQVESIDRIEEVKQSVEKLLRIRHRIQPGADADFSIRDYTEFISALKETGQTFTVLLGGVAAVSLLVGGIGVMNIMLVSVTERTREIGVRMAVGARRRDIMLQFLIEALVITVTGGIIGIILGASMAYGIAEFGNWETVITPFSILLAFFFSIFVGMLFGIYPARKASLLDPIVALRYE
ncbi:MAG: ABC transporter permease [Proteobacteria bacterium]|nr:ABC transporter permease [Pseudomonadota bacterium]